MDDKKLVIGADDDFGFPSATSHLSTVRMGRSGARQNLLCEAVSETTIPQLESSLQTSEDKAGNPLQNLPGAQKIELGSISPY